MRDRLLLAIDQFEPGQAAVDFTIGLAAKSGANVTVFHVRELSKSLRVPPIETLADAHLLVDHTVLRMQVAGVATEGHLCSSREDVAKVHRGRVVAPQVRCHRARIPPASGLSSHGRVAGSESVC